LGISAVQNIRSARKIDRLHDLTTRQAHPRSGCYVATGLNDAIITERDADSRICPQQATLSDEDNLFPSAGQRAHDRRTAAYIATIANNNSRTDTAFHHGGP
jgi:hypothetical protein